MSSETDNTFRLALEHHQAGRLAQAEALYRQILAQDPREAQVLQLLGVLAGQTRRYELAVDLLRQSVAIDPTQPHSYFNLGVALTDLRQLDAAIEAYRTAIRLNPQYAFALSNLGTCLREKGQLTEAIAVYRRALPLRPIAESHTNLAKALYDAGNLDEAIDLLQRSLTLGPSADAYCSLGVAYWDCGRRDEGLALVRKSLSLDPRLAEGHKALAHFTLSRGEFAEGFKEYAWRERVKGAPPPRLDPERRWDGRPLDGKIVLLHNDQGLGDEIQFVRYVPMVIARGGRVRIHCRNELLALFESIPSVELFPYDKPYPPHDAHALLLDLPSLLGSRLETIPAAQAYLHAPADRVQAWGERMRPLLGRFNVGLCWAGNPNHKRDAQRSIAPEHLAGLGRIPGVAFFSLQKRVPGAAAVSPPGIHLIDMTDQLADFADTAAMMSHLDLIVSVDTSVLHLAGAIGRPAWGLIAYASDWRWFLCREDSPWYPTVRLFRQKRIGDWAEVMSRVSEELSNDP